MKPALLALLLLATPLAAQEALPDGDGQEETVALCTACHNTTPILRTRLPRAQWDGLMDWMVEKHGMNPLEGELRTTIVDYLARHFGPLAQPRARNPFLN